MDQWPGPIIAQVQPMGSILSGSLGLNDYLQVGERSGWATDEDVQRVSRLLQEACHYIAEQITIFSPCFVLESSAIITKYQHFIPRLPEMSEDVVLEELSYSLALRCAVEPYVRASVVLHPALLVSAELHATVQRTDEQLRVIASTLYQRAGMMKSAASLTGEERCRYLIDSALNKWWWWLSTQ